jgi:hypothetical protein
MSDPGWPFSSLAARSKDMETLKSINQLPKPIAAAKFNDVEVKKKAGTTTPPDLRVIKRDAELQRLTHIGTKKLPQPEPAKEANA